METQVKSTLGSEQERARKLESAEKLKSDDLMDVARHLRRVLIRSGVEDRKLGVSA